MYKLHSEEYKKISLLLRRLFALREWQLEMHTKVFIVLL